MPKDPTALMSLAYQKNGLNSPDVHPWHIRGTYTVFDHDGKAVNTGVYEEWWISPEKYKRSYTGTLSKQVEYATGNALYREGDQDWLNNRMEQRLRASLIGPLPNQETLKEFNPKAQSISIGKDKLSCAELSYELRPNLQAYNLFSKFCFQPTLPILRIYLEHTFQTTYSQIALFQGRYLARKLETSINGKPIAELDLDLAEELKDPPADLLTPPADALPIDISTVPLRLKKNIGLPVLLKQPPPEFPPHSTAQGTVVLRITVGKDGRVSSLQVISGPQELQKNALDAVRQWYYQPFLVMGKPIDVDIDVDVNFRRSF